MATCDVEERDRVEKREELDDIMTELDGHQERALLLKSRHFGVPTHCKFLRLTRAAEATIECPDTYCRVLIFVRLTQLLWSDKNNGTGNIVDRRHITEKMTEDLLNICVRDVGRKNACSCGRKHKDEHTWKLEHRDLRDQCIQAFDGENYDQMNNENENLSHEKTPVKSELLEKDRLWHQIYMQHSREKERLLGENKCLKEALIKSRKALEELKVEHQETLMELGEMLAVRTAEINKTSDAEMFQKIFHSNSPTSTMEISKTKPTTASSVGEPGFSVTVTNDQTKGCENQNQKHVKTDSPLVPTDETTSSAENLSFPIQVNQPGKKGCVNLIDEPTSSTTANIRNNYKFLLLTTAYSLLASNIVKLKEWASEKFFIEPNASAIEIIFELDKKGVINAFDISELHAFLESILRYDLVFLIDEFCAGDYTSLRSRMIHSRYITRTDRRATYAHTRHSQRVDVASDTVSSRPLNRVTSNGGSPRVWEIKRPSFANTSTSNVSDERSRETLNRNYSKRSDPIRVGFSGAAASRNSDVVTDDQEVNNTRVTKGYTSPRREATCMSNDIPTTSGGSNGAKMSKLSRPDQSRTSNIQACHLAQKSCSGSSQSQGIRKMNGSSQDIDQKEKWLCSHYNRGCYVKFECCSKFWACHRCHNNHSSCGRKKLKSRETTMLKCVVCGKEQQFGRYCVQCNMKFAEFYCGLCKHLTGMDDQPYHCDKCGICRIHGDRSFHCDVCGACMDVQMRGNHKCLQDSAHDECCFCLEDTFAGCQILPCLHKIHKECATQMIRNAITRCPKCQESFAHKLERRSGRKNKTS